MKEIINKQYETETVNIYNVNIFEDNNPIIAYVTSGGKGLGISSRLDNGYYGFYYHKDLVFNDKSRPKFIASTKMASLIKVLDAGRSLFLFSTFEEFVTFAAKI